jgi:hypothetical protein
MVADAKGIMRKLRIQERSKTRDRLQKFLNEVCERYFADTDQLGSTESENKLLVIDKKNCIITKHYCNSSGCRHDGLINFIDTNAKCRYPKILHCNGTLRQVFIRVYSLEIGEIQSVALVLPTQLCELLLL